MEINSIRQNLSNLTNDYKSKANSILTLHHGINWFLENFKGIEIQYLDMRGGDVNPSIILSCPETTIIRDDIQQRFETSDQYNLFKKHLLTVGYLTRANCYYFYIQCNDALRTSYTNKGNKYTNTRIKEIMRARAERELFPHIDKYFKKS